MSPQRDMAQRRGAYARFLVLALASMALAVAGLVASAAYLLGVIDKAVIDISTNAVPSMVLLGQARADLRTMQDGIADRLDSPPGEAERQKRNIEDARHRLSDHLEQYWAAPTFPGETELWPEIRTLLAEVDAGADRILAIDPASAATSSASTLLRAHRHTSTALDAALMRTIRFDARVAQELSARILDVHRRALPGALALSVLGIVVAGGAIVQAYRLIEDALRREREAREELARRAGELEAFSSRVAHDLLSPLMAVSLALGLAEQRLPAAEKEQLGSALSRAQHSLEGVRRLVDGLLGFARAGARPQPGDRSDACEIVRGVVDDHQPVACQAGVDLTLSACSDPPVLVACSPGVLISLLSNLLQNAIKVLSESPVRRVSVRVSREPPVARFQVEDTGPGIATEHHGNIFEPHVRGPTARGGGFGLGLATVKRLAESCGGGVGLKSEPGRGALFWFTLPLAMENPVASDAAPRGGCPTPRPGCGPIET